MSDAEASDALDGWEFTEDSDSVNCSHESGSIDIWVEDGGTPMFIIEDYRDSVPIPLPTLRAVLDELERRARAKWGPGWGET